MPTDVLTEIERLTHRFGPAAVDAGLVHLRDSRIGQSDEGRAALGVVDALVDRYGDDAIEWLFRRARARLERRVDRRGDDAHDAVDEAAERALERVRSTLPGDGHL